MLCVYGAIIVLAMLAAMEARVPEPIDIAAALFGTLLVVAFAHSHAEISGRDYDNEARLPSRESVTAIIETWPLPAAAALPGTLFLVAATGAVTVKFAFGASFAFVCVSLIVIGYWSQRRIVNPFGRSAAVGAADPAFGLVIVALKFLLD